MGFGPRGSFKAVGGGLLFFEPWTWWGVDPPDMYQSVLETWDWWGVNPPDMYQSVLEEWSS